MAGSPIFAVLDVETTGFSPMVGGRIVEIAIARVNDTGTIADEYSTLLNPHCPVGSTDLHGIAQRDVEDAPTFEEIAGDILGRLQGLILVGHNVRYDRDFLAAELSSMGVFLPSIPCLCTLKFAHRLHPELANHRLSTCCSALKLDHSHPHEALGEARSTAQLLIHYMEEARLAGVTTSDVLDGDLTFPASWPTIPPSGRFKSRLVRGPVADTMPFLARLAADRIGVAPDEGLAPYVDLLDKALEDRRLTESETVALQQTATAWGLSPAQVTEAHEAYLRALVTAALTDGWISSNERHDLQTVVGLLRMEAGMLDSMIGSVAEDGS